MKTLKYKILGLGLAALSLTTACSDFLDEDPKGQVTTAVAFTQASDIKGGYATLYYQVRMLEYTAKAFAYQLGGDDATTCWGKDDAREFDTYYNYAGNPLLVAADIGPWNAYFLVINAANYILNNVDNLYNYDKKESTDQEIKYLKGQCYFWRAYSYFGLVRIFGGVPLLTKDDYATINRDVAPASEQEVYDYVVADLKEAEKLLPATYDKTAQADIGWSGANNKVASQGAAKATLACVYLNMAGWPLNKGAEYYTLCAQKAKEVIDLSENGTYPYKFAQDFNDVFDERLDLKNPEHILVCPFDKNSKLGDGGGLKQVIDYEMPAGGNGWGSALGEVKYWADYPAGPRKKAMYGDGYVGKNINLLNNKTTSDLYIPGTFEGKTWPLAPNDPSRRSEFKVTSTRTGSVWVPWFFTGDKVDKDSKIGVDAAPYFLYRFSIWENGDQYYFVDGKPKYSQFEYYGDCQDGDSFTSVVLCRLTEVYLWYAEAVGRGGQGDKALALKYLNMVRERGVGNSDSNYTADQLAEGAYNEHGYEVMGNIRGMQTRYQDMRRMDRVKDYFEARKTYGDKLIDVTEIWLRENPDKVDYYNTLYNVQKALAGEGEWAQYKDDPANNRHKIIDGVYHVFMPWCHIPMEKQTTWDQQKCMYSPYPSKETTVLPNLK